MSACSSANLPPVVEKENLIPESQSLPGDIFVPTWKAGKLAAFDVTVIRCCNPTLSLMRVQNQDTRLMRQMKEHFAFTTITAQKWESPLFSLQLKSLAEYRQPFKKTLKRLAVLSDNRSFQAKVLSVAFCKLMQSWSIAAIRGSATILLVRAP